MFGAIGTFVFRMRFAVIAVLVAIMGGLGLYGLGLGNHLSQSGWFDPTAQSSKGSVVADTAFGRDHRSDVILLITPPAGTLVDDKQFGSKVEQVVDDLVGDADLAAEGAERGAEGQHDQQRHQPPLARAEVGQRLGRGEEGAHQGAPPSRARTASRRCAATSNGWPPP